MWRALSGDGLVELVLGYRRGVGRVEGGGLVEAVERRAAGGSNRWGFGGQAKVHENGLELEAGSVSEMA